MDSLAQKNLSWSLKLIQNVVLKYISFDCFEYLDVDKKQEDVILPPPLIPMKIVDDFEDVDKELEEELENMNLDDIESTVTHYV